MDVQHMLDLFHTVGVHDALYYLAKEIEAIGAAVEEFKASQAVPPAAPEGDTHASGS